MAVQGRAHFGFVRGNLGGGVSSAGTNMSYAPRRRPAFRHKDAFIRACHAHQASRCGSSTSMNAAGRGRILAALEVHRAKILGRCESTTGMEAFDRLVAQGMGQAPYKDARRVFWTMDNGSSHPGQRSMERLTRAYPRLVPAHAPVHASWLNQIERSTSGCCSAKRSQPMTLRTWRQWRNVCTNLSDITKASRNHLKGKFSL